ncbi:MAG: sulfoxide reductase heme-binding subunit YedZ [Gammaproteobacteria bacterium]|nr:sulfoxide reductase heme-binding subunit YedZ [Gammaproteobacteria bacterium]
MATLIRLQASTADWIYARISKAVTLLSSAAQTAWIKRLKPILFIACLLPFAQLIYDAFSGGLGADPIEDITFRTGDWALRLLLITLAITPLRHLSGWNALIRVRRMLGLFAFFYMCLHFLTYIVLDQFFAWNFILEDIIERNYILVGFSAFVLLIPLAVTSTNGMMRRLGGKRWQRLHRLVYVAAICGVIHFLWLVKSDITEPAIYALTLITLFAMRLYHRYAKATQAPARPTQGAQAN